MKFIGADYTKFLNMYKKFVLPTLRAWEEHYLNG